jgi:hypothetical protein
MSSTEEDTTSPTLNISRVAGATAQCEEAPPKKESRESGIQWLFRNPLRQHPPDEEIIESRSSLLQRMKVEAEFDPSPFRGRTLLAHELPHVVQQGYAPSSRGPSTPASNGVPSNATFVQRQPVAEPEVEEASDESTEEQIADYAVAVPPQVQRRLAYAATVLRDMPPITAEQEGRLERAIRGAPLYTQIRTKRFKVREIETRNNEIMRIRPEHGTLMPGTPEVNRVEELSAEVEHLGREVEELDRSIREGLATLGVAGEDELVHFVEEEFPRMFLDRAKQLVYTMLDTNRALAESERDRYSEQVCSLDIEGLLAADRELLAIQGEIETLDATINRAQVYVPIAGVPEPTPEAYGMPPNEASLIMDVLRLPELRDQLERKRIEYTTARAEHSRSFPILGAQGYQPGMFANAPPEQLAQVVAEPIEEILENIRDVREDIEDDDLKVWNLRDVVEMTKLELAVEGNEVLNEAIDSHIQRQIADEGFVRLALAALAITTTIIAGLIGGPLAAALVGAAWGVGSLVGNIQEYATESAAENVSLDPEIADISMNEPNLLWIVLDIVFLALDVGAAKALRPFARALQASRSAEDFARFAAGARAALPAGPAAAIIRRASLRFGIDPTLLPEAAEILASKATRLVHTPREVALRELLDEAQRAGVTIRADEEAQRLLDWAARAAGENPANYHAVTIGGDIFVRPQFADNVRVLREELIHVYQQSAGMEVSAQAVVGAEIEARLMMIARRHAWSMTNDEVREMIQEVRRMRATGRY